MKQSTVVIKLIVATFFLALLAYLSISAWRMFTDPVSTVAVYRDTVSDAVEVTGWLVREEEVLPGGTGYADLLLSEGERVGAGQAVAVYYRDEAAIERKQATRALELELEQLHYAMRQGGDPATMDKEIIDAITGLHGIAAREDFSTRLDEGALRLKSLVFRRELAYGNTESGSLEEIYSNLTTAIDALYSASVEGTARITAARAGLFSSQADGYESSLTPAALEGLTVSGFTALTAGQPQPPTGATGKLITGTRWYFTALLPVETAARLTEGGQIPVVFSRDYSGEVVMRVDQISPPENGQVAVVLSCDRSLSEITMLRRQTVSLVFARHTGLLVPQNAVRVLTETVTDDETGAVTERQITGVFSLRGNMAEFRPVTIIAEVEGHYLVVANPASAADRRILRAGDAVIISSEDLYSGKVVR